LHCKLYDFIHGVIVLEFQTAATSAKQDAMRSRFRREIYEKHGLIDGMMISMSKSRYTEAHPRNQVVFNSTIVFDDVPGIGTATVSMCDIDLTKSMESLKAIAKKYRCEIRIYYEYDMDMKSPTLKVLPGGKLEGHNRVLDAFNVDERRE